MKIILASASPRRLKILRDHGVEPVVMPTDTDENIEERLSPAELPKELSRRKAFACYESICRNPEELEKYKDHIIIGADTIVYKDEIMGKPKDEDDAFRMIASYRGTYHYVITGVTLIKVCDGSSVTRSETTKVWCKDFTDRDIRDYISSDEPYDKAGAYAIQGDFGRYIDHIEGDYENVVGLPFHIINLYAG